MPVLSVALHTTSESRPFDQIPGPPTLEHFSTETCFHLFLNLRAGPGSCSVPFSITTFSLSCVCHAIYLQTNTTVSDGGAVKKAEESPCQQKTSLNQHSFVVQTVKGCFYRAEQYNTHTTTVFGHLNVKYSNIQS